MGKAMIIARYLAGNLWEPEPEALHLFTVGKNCHRVGDCSKNYFHIPVFRADVGSSR